MTTKPTTGQKALPIDDPDLSDREATFASLRLILENQDLIKARLDGLTETISVLATRPAVTATPAPTSAAPVVRPYTGGGAAAAPVGGTRRSWGLVGLVERQVPKKSGGTFTVIEAQFSNGYKRDVPKNFVNWFAERAGQEVSFTEAKNEKGYNAIVAVG